MIYLTGASNTGVLAQRHPRIGLMCQPGNSNHLQIDLYPAWAADNACYGQGERFDLDVYLSWLDTLPRRKCLFAVAPDVVGNATATIARSLPVLPQIRALKFPAAFVAQDGLERMTVPWDAFDVFFIGGTTGWKLSPMALMLIWQAKAIGKPVHMGRVNSRKRFITARDMGCDTVDGTYLAYGPDANLPKLLRWLKAA